MAFKVMADNGINIPSSHDGAMYNAFASTDFIISGIGNEYNVTFTDTSLEINVGTGEAVISGRHITSNEINTLTLSANDTYFIVLRIDLTQTAGNEGMIVALTSEDLVQESNLNNGGTIHDLLLCEVTTSTTGVSNFTDERKILTSSLAASSEITVSTSWTDDTATSGYFTQTIPFDCTSSDVLQFGLKKTFVLANDETLEAEFSKIKIIDSQDGSLLVYAAERTTATIALIVKGA